MWGMVKTKSRNWVALRFGQRVLLKCLNSDFQVHYLVGSVGCAGYLGHLT